MRTRRDSRPRIAMIVDHPQRDLAGMVLTAAALGRRGAVCHLVPLNLQSRELLALAPDLVLLNYLRRGNEEVARTLLAAGVRVGLLDTEGAVWSDCGAYTELLWEDSDLLQRIGPACMWGPTMAECVRGAGLLDSSQMVVTGCPRFDLYHPDWRGVAAESPTGAAPRILINTNFSGVNPRFSTVDQNRRHFAERFGWPADRIETHLEAERGGIAALIDIARRLTHDHPAAEIRVRPHPFENADHYRRALADLPRIQVANERPVQADLFEATAVIQRSCSTAIESAMAGVPTYSARWVPTPVEVPIAEAVSVPCEDYASLSVGVGEALAGHPRIPAQVAAATAAVIQDYFHRMDGRSHERVADAALDALRTPSRVSLRRCLDALYQVNASTPTLASSAGSRARRVLGLSPYWSFRSGRAEPPSWWSAGAKAFGADDVGAIAARVARALAARTGGESEIVARPSSEAGEYICRFEGYSQTVMRAA